MECQASDSKKLFKVFDASKHRRSKKKRESGGSRSAVRSAASNESTSGQIRVVSAKASLQQAHLSKTEAFSAHDEREIDSSPTLSGSQSKYSPSPRRHRRPMRDGMSLALKAGLTSTPRSNSPSPENDGTLKSLPQDQGSFIYAFLEEAIKRDKKKQRHSRRHEDRERPSRPQTTSPCEPRDHRDKRDRRDHRDHRDHRDRRHHRRETDEPKEPKPPKAENPAPALDQNALIETFAKLCATINTKTENPTTNPTSIAPIPTTNTIPSSLSHKSLQCEGIPKNVYSNDVDHRPVKLRSHDNPQDYIPTSRVRSHEDSRELLRSRDNIAESRSHLTQTRGRSTYCVPYNKENNTRERYSSKLIETGSQMHNNIADDRCREYAPRTTLTRSCLDQSYRRNVEDERGYIDHIPNREPTRDCDHRRQPNREYDHDRELDRDHSRVREPDRARYYEDERRRYFDQKTSRSFDVHRDPCVEDDRARRTTRSDVPKDKRYEERRYGDRDRERPYEEIGKRDKYSRDRRYNASRERRESRIKKTQEPFSRVSVTSREDEYKEKDRFSEKERDSGFSVADGESTVSARSNYLRLVKQEIVEQREAMDKMMNLWKELMRCFKRMSSASGSEKAVTESAANNARESAASQLRLWRECMRRYETVARDVGDTDARLMEEINKQRSEMAEMATMWQECLQRYREMSNDFNNLKQKLAAPPSPTRTMVCAEGEGPAPPAPFRPPAYPPMPVPGYSMSPVRARASVPPAWWWNEAPGVAHAPPCRRSSPDSRGSRDRDCERNRDRDRDRDRRRHKERGEREDSKYKEKSKPSTAHSEHRRRKR